jgi:hypothetical protein
MESSKLFALIEQLEKKGFKGSAYRRSIAKALAGRIQESHPLPELMIGLLEKFLAEVSITFNGGARQVDTSSTHHEFKKGCILWGRDMEPVPTDESYSILYTLTLALLQPQPRQADRWLEILDKHLRRGDSINVWCSLSATYLRFLSFCERGSAEAFLSNLLESYPGLFDGDYATQLLAQTMSWTSENFAMRWTSHIGQLTEERSAQAFGEVLCFQHLWFQDRIWPRETINELIMSEHTNSNTLVGLAYVASKLWHHTKYRERASELIDSLLARNTARIVSAVATYISNGESYSVDQHTEQVLSRLSETEFLTGHSMFNVLESIVELTPWKPDFVYDICMKILKAAGANIGDIRTSECMLSGPLLDVAIRLQRMDGKHRGQGMDVFEALLRYRTHEAVGLLHTLDGRPKSESTIQMPRRRQKKVKRG